jgi:hypothetical protein
MEEKNVMLDMFTPSKDPASEENGPIVLIVHEVPTLQKICSIIEGF